VAALSQEPGGSDCPIIISTARRNVKRNLKYNKEIKYLPLKVKNKQELTHRIVM
jgi:hypothetical protein